MGIGDEVTGQRLLDSAGRLPRLVRPAVQKNVGPVLRPDLFVYGVCPAAGQRQRPIDTAPLRPPVMLHSNCGHQRWKCPAVYRQPPVRAVLRREVVAVLEPVNTPEARHLRSAADGPVLQRPQ